MAVGTAALVSPGTLPAILFFEACSKPWRPCHVDLLWLRPPRCFYVQETSSQSNRSCPVSPCRGRGGVRSGPRGRPGGNYRRASFESGLGTGNSFQEPCSALSGPAVFSSTTRCLHTWCRQGTRVPSSQSGYSGLRLKSPTRSGDASLQSSRESSLVRDVCSSLPARIPRKETRGLSLQGFRSLHSGVPGGLLRGRAPHANEAAAAVTSEQEGHSDLLKERVKRRPMLCLGVAVHRDVVGYALIQVSLSDGQEVKSGLPTRRGFVGYTGASGHMVPSRSPAVAASACVAHI